MGAKRRNILNRSKSEFHEKFWSRVNIKEEWECWEWTGGGCSGGYGAYFLGGRKSMLAHRASYMLAVGGLVEGMFICHKCNNRICVNPKHLYQGTARDNIMDSIACGTHNFPVGGGREISVSEKDAIEIRNAVMKYGVRKMLMEKYGVSRGTIYNVRRGKLYGLEPSTAKKSIRTLSGGVCG